MRVNPHFKFQKIPIAGHGLGACMAIRYGAMRNVSLKSAGIKGVIAIASPYSLPDTIRRRWERFGSTPTYNEIYTKAKRIFKPLAGEIPAQDEPVIVKEFCSIEEVLDIKIVLQFHGLLGYFLARCTPRLQPHAFVEHVAVFLRASHSELAFCPFPLV